MRLPRNTTRLSIIGLVVLGLVALGLSIAALRQPRTVAAVPSTGQSSTTSVPTVSPSPEASSAQTPTPAPSTSPTSATPSPTPTTRLTAVIVGDSFSVGEPTQSWVGPVAAKLGWTNVVNYSSPGRGYLAAPRACEFKPCANFVGTLPLVVAAQPDVVVTFGGVADGDVTIKTAAADYYRALRAALPDAQVVAISPITTDAEAPYWLRSLHAQSIKAGVEAVGGSYVDVGQPGLGNGNALSAEAQAAIAQRVNNRLSQG